jgi:hypothetical protein
MSIIKQIAKEAKGMLLDGIGASEHVDSSGEILDVKGCDIQDVKDGVAVINYEHKDDSPTDVIGRLVYAKKIYSAEDCDDDRQLMYWKKSGVPYIYIIGELMDQDGHQGAKDAAAIVRHYHTRKLPIVARWSIEGSTLDKDKNASRLKRSIFKRIALTLKPCNKDATSGVLFDPFEGKSAKKDESLKSITDKIDKFEHPMYTKLGGAMEVECMPWIDDMTKKELTKEEELKAKFKKIVKEWDGSGDLKAFVKSNLPEISDEFLDKFATVADNYQVKVKKFEQLEETIYKLVKASEEVTKESDPKKNLPNVEFGGKQVKPGKALLSRHGQAALGQQPGTNPYQQLALIGHDPDERTFTAVPNDKVTGWEDKDLFKVPMDHKGLQVQAFPEEVNALPIVDSSVHGVNLTPDAAQLVHGMELDPKNVLSMKHLGTKRTAYWTNNAAGKLVFVKPDEPTMPVFGDSGRETAFHNTAKEFFGLGNYLPSVATIRHPKTGQLHTIVEAVPGEHTETQAWTKSAPSKQEHVNTLNKLGDSGELDKLGIMDTIMGNNDRHHQNYLFTPDGSIKMIDHGFTFDSGALDNDPDYLEKYNAIKKMQGQPDQSQQPLHPATAQWLLTLNPTALQRTLRKNGTPLRHAVEAARKLQTMQQAVATNPQAKKWDIYNAPAGIQMAAGGKQ